MPLAYQPRDETLGRYQLCAKLGRGGMAELYVARLVGTGGFEKLVAIKKMLPHLSEDPQFVTMFKNEGRIAAQLDHPNVCQVYELGEADDGQLYMAMEFLRGMAWSEIATAIPDQPRDVFVRFVAGMFVQACEGLHYAHTSTDVDGQPRPIVHRDVSPPNLFVTTDGVVKLLDFGVSKVLTEGTSTRTGMIKGKLPYMAPEQIRGEPVDARADVFSLGVVLWEAIAGKTLFDRGSDYQIWKAVTEDKIPSLPDPKLDAVVQLGLARDRNDRLPTARAFAEELRLATTEHGPPMTAAELAKQLREWLEPSLSRRSRDLAAVIGKLRTADAVDNTMTTPYLDISNVPKAAVTDIGRAMPIPDSGSTTMITTAPVAASAELRRDSIIAPPPQSIAVTLETIEVDSMSPTLRPYQMSMGPHSMSPTLIAAARAIPDRVGRRPIDRRWLIAGALGLVVVVTIVIALWPASDPPAPPPATDPITTPILPPIEPAIVTPLPPDDAAAAVAVDAAPEPADVIQVEPKPPVAKQSPPPPHEPKLTGTGLFTIGSKGTYASISIDGKVIDNTPIYQLKLAAGPHTVKAVRNGDGKSKTFRVMIKPNEEKSMEVTW